LHHSNQIVIQEARENSRLTKFSCILSIHKGYHLYRCKFRIRILIWSQTFPLPLRMVRVHSQYHNRLKLSHFTRFTHFTLRFLKIVIPVLSILDIPLV
jgi:hypothetical protein